MPGYGVGVLALTVIVGGDMIFRVAASAGVWAGRKINKTKERVAT